MKMHMILFYISRIFNEVSKRFYEVKLNRYIILAFIMYINHSSMVKLFKFDIVVSGSTLNIFRSFKMNPYYAYSSVKL